MELEDLKKLIEDSAAENRRQFDRIDGQFADLRRHFDVTAEGLRHEIRLVAEGVMLVNERVDRLQIEMRDEFADVRATIATLVRS